MKQLKIAIIGYGKMGKMIQRLAADRGHQIVSIIEKDNQTDFDSPSFLSADVAIEFSTPDSAFNNLLACIDRRIPVVCGTTAWLDKFQTIQEACINNKAAFLYASNFSLGVNLFFELNRKLARLMQHHSDYASDIEEIHHTQKVDAPSGTAIHLANDLIENHSAYDKYELVEHNQIPDSSLPIRAKRIDNVPGTHTITYQSSVDKISIQHEAFSREGFALGALLAAEYISGKTGIFTMKDVLAESL